MRFLAPSCLFPAAGPGWLPDPARVGLFALFLLIAGLTILFVSVILWMWDRTRRSATEEEPPPPDPIFDPDRGGEGTYRRRVPIRDRVPGTVPRRPAVEMFPEDWGLLAEVPGAVVVLFHGRIRCATREFGRRVGVSPELLAGREFKEFLGARHLLEVVERLEALDRGEIERCHLAAELAGDPEGPPVSLHGVRVAYGAEHVVLVSLAPILVATMREPGGGPAPTPAAGRPPAAGSAPPPAPPEGREKGAAPGGEAGTAVAALLANVSHELQTPLVSVRGYTEMILKGRMGPLTPDQEKGLQISLRNIDRLIERIDELLEFTRERPDSALRTEDFPLWEVIEAAIETVQQRNGVRGVSVTTSYETDRLSVRADRERIRQVLTNLLHNAVKFNRPGGTVHIAVRDGDEGFLQVEVRDTGIGIPRHALPRIFDRFYQVGGGEREGREGSGLGLAIVKSILDRHGCSIRVESEPSVGTTFRFDLPRGADGEAGDGPPRGGRDDRGGFR